MTAYQIFTDATADLREEFMEGLPAVEIIPMQVEICGREYTYGPNGNLTTKEFYQMQRDGNFAKTSQINPATYTKYFEETCKQGKDVLYLCFSSGLSSTYQSAQTAISELSSKYPERTLLCVDTLGATVGEALLVREAARLQKSGAAIEETASLIAGYRNKVCYRFIVDTFDHLHHGGRVSKAVAVAGTALQIKPMLHVSKDGRLELIEKPRGRKRALLSMVEHLEKGQLSENTGDILIAHADCPEYAEELKELIVKRFPYAQPIISELGPVIGAHTGPGLLVIVYWGSIR